MPSLRWRFSLSRGRPWWRRPRAREDRGAEPAGGSWAWLEPFPDTPAGPAAASMSLAFVTALQQLPPRERAALILSDVLAFDPAEVADILDCDPADVDHLLLRARAAVAGVVPPLRPPSRPGPAGPADQELDPELDEDAVVARFTGAFQRGDVAAITALLTRDAWLRMRPLPVQYRGRSAARYFLATVAFPGGTPCYRLVATRANGQPAFGCYLRDTAAGVDHACGLVVLTIDGGRIAAIDRFVDNSVLPRFGLPRTIPEDLPATDS